MAKKKRLGSDPLSWIKDSRNDEEETQNPEKSDEKETEEKEAVETENEPETTAETVETEALDEEDVELENVEIQHDVQEEEEEEELMGEDVPIQNDENQAESSGEVSDVALQIESGDEETLRDQKQIIIFRLNNELYGIDIKEVKEIVHHRTITALPSAPDAVAGTINLRKQVISVLNLKKRLDMKDTDYEDGAPIIILQNQEYLTGILVDEVREVSYVDNFQIEDAPEGAQDKLITGIIKMPDALISLIDSKKISLQHELAYEQETDVTEKAKKETTAKDAVVDVGQFVGFFIRDDEFGVDIREIQEINKLVPITEVPRSPQFVEGVINLRGQIVPVIDLRVRFNIQRKGYDKKTRIIVINVNNKKIGLIVDSVSEVLRIPLSDIQDPPAEAVSEGMEFINGIAEINDRLVVILDLKSILTHQQIKDIGVIKEYTDAAASTENNLENGLEE
jgi:purine-binding chemotaxis protein CheW